VSFEKIKEIDVNLFLIVDEKSMAKDTAIILKLDFHS